MIFLLDVERDLEDRWIFSARWARKNHEAFVCSCAVGVTGPGSVLRRHEYLNASPRI